VVIHRSKQLTITPDGKMGPELIVSQSTLLIIIMQMRKLLIIAMAVMLQNRNTQNQLDIMV
jgi:hypothetical protein